MKKIVFFLFAAIAMIAFGAGTARADRGFWNINPGLDTYVNIVNTGSQPHTVQVNFYYADGTAVGTFGTGVVSGSTSQTLAPNARWAFAVSTANQPSTATLNTTGHAGSGNVTTSGLGSVTIIQSDATADNSCQALGNVSCIHGYTTVATSGLSGFNFTFPAGTNIPRE